MVSTTTVPFLHLTADVPAWKQPVRYWRPLIAVSGPAFYNSELFTLWRNKLLIGVLAFEEVQLADVD